MRHKAGQAHSEVLFAGRRTNMNASNEHTQCIRMLPLWALPSPRPPHPPQGMPGHQSSAAPAGAHPAGAAPLAVATLQRVQPAGAGMFDFNPIVRS